MNEFKFYGLREPPFSVSPDPRFLYISPQHQSAIAKTEYIISHRQGMGVIFGDVGLGKTTLARRIYEIFGTDPDYNVAFISTPRFKSEHQFLLRIAAEFGVDSKRSGYETLNALEAKLVEVFRSGVISILLIDEAQMLVGPQFELLRQLLNFETNDAKMLQIILVGQNELRAKLRAKRALLSRVAVQSTLEPFDPATMEEMLAFRLMVAGRDTPLFTPEALEELFSFTKGIPREVVKVCMTSLPLGAGAKRKLIDAEIMAQAISSVLAAKKPDERADAS